MIEGRLYTWVRPGFVDQLTTDLDAYCSPTHRPAVQVWADELLQLYAANRPDRPVPSIEIHSRSLFCWRGPNAPMEITSSTHERVRFRVEVEAAGCASADMSFINPLYTESGWTRCVVDLIDRGIQESRLREELSFLGDARRLVETKAERAHVRQTDAEILDEVLGHFHWSLAGYLDSWSVYNPAADLAPLAEIVCPAEAIIGIRPAPEPSN